MKRKGQLGIGVFLMAFIAIIAGLALFQGLGPFIGQTTGSVDMRNRTFTMPAVGSTTDLVGQELLGTPIVINASTGLVVPSTNYTIAEGLSSVDGLKRIRLTSLGGWSNDDNINVSYLYGAEGYIDSGGGRSIALLIPLFFGLAIALIALTPSLREKFMDMIGK